MVGFSRDNPGPSPNFRPGPGQLGEHAALQQARPQRQPAQRKPRQSAQRHREGASLGMGRKQEQVPDQSHLLYAAMHTNSTALGRDLPFGLWAYQNGYYPDLAPGKQMPDWLD